MPAVLNPARSGDCIVSTGSIYGGTFNLFAVTLKRMGIDVTFVDQHASDAEIAAAIRPEPRSVFGETLSNPSMDVPDIERLPRIAHEHGLPLIVDNTFATPVLCRPLDFGTDIVTHSTTKYMDGHAVQRGGGSGGSFSASPNSNFTFGSDGSTNGTDASSSAPASPSSNTGQKKEGEALGSKGRDYFMTGMRDLDNDLQKGG